MTAAVYVPIAAIEDVLARVEAGRADKDDANLIRAIIQQLQGKIEALEEMVDDDTH